MCCAIECRACSCYLFYIVLPPTCSALALPMADEVCAWKGVCSIPIKVIRDAATKVGMPGGYPSRCLTEGRAWGHWKTKKFVWAAPLSGLCTRANGLPRGQGHNLLMQFSRLGSSKMEISETDFFDTLTIQNGQISYGKHVLAPLHVFFTLFGCWRGGGAPKGAGVQPAYALF